MEKNNKKSGWHEDADPTCTNKKGKIVARRHHNAAVGKELQNTLRAPLFSRDKECEEVIKEVQDSRKPGAIARDNTITAEKVGDKEDPEDVAEWAKNPGRVDLKGVDDENEEPDEPEEKDEEDE